MKKKMKNVCIVATNYALLLYLIKMSDDDIKHTFFIFDCSMPTTTGKNIDQLYRMPNYSFTSHFLKRLILRYNYLKLNFSSNISIYAQDHFLAAEVFIGKKDYTFIEDSAKICSKYYQSKDGIAYLKKSKRLNVKLKQFFQGSLYGGKFAHNNQVKELLLTEEDDADFISGKPRLFVPTINHELWLSFSEWKRRFILKTFGVNELFFEQLKKDSILLLTQPLTESRGFSTDDQIEVYKNIICNYPSEKVIIKTHPRDLQIKYEEYFPMCVVIRESFPSEFFNFYDIHFSRIATAFSYSVKPFIGKTPVDWYGSKVTKKLFQIQGTIDAPIGVNVINSNSSQDTLQSF